MTQSCPDKAALVALWSLLRVHLSGVGGGRVDSGDMKKSQDGSS